MQSPLKLLKVIGKGLLNAVGGGVLGELVVEVLPEVARDVSDWWLKDAPPEEQREQVLALLQAPANEVRALVSQAVAEVAADQSPEVQKALTDYLSLVPNSLRRSAGPNPLLLDLKDPDDVLPLLPSRLPRFRPGDRPLPGIDWELVELLGTGGFGEVWKARNPHFDAVPPVALKFCLDPAAKDRLLRHEAGVLNQVMRQGRHSGIVALQHTYLSAAPPCLEYEYVSGGDMTGLIQQWRTRPPGADSVAHLMWKLAAIVGHAHRLTPPVVHRDLKPANVLIQTGDDGSLHPRVADFGIGGVAASHALARTGRSVSQAGFLVTALRGSHTPLYASPQQTRGRGPDPRDDVFSLGVIWYQMLTANLTASRPGGTRWTQRLMDKGMSSELIDLLAACVEEEADDRPKDAAELAERLAKTFEPPKPAPPPVVARPEPKPAPERSRLLTNSIGMKLALIRSGSFFMGSTDHEEHRAADEGPQRHTQVAQPFYLGVYPVTQHEYETVMGDNPSHFTRAEGGSPLHPVENVSWADAVEFCRRLSALPEEKRAGRRYELPTELQWEFACRAGTLRAFAFGNDLSASQANFDGTKPYGRGGPGPCLKRTSKVGSYPANAWGLHDMHGNVWEWCQDWYDEHFYSVAVFDRETRGPMSGTLRVLRGGSWNNSGHLLRSARRNKYAPDFRNSNIGFRVVLRVG